MVNSEVLNFKHTLQPLTGDDFSQTVQMDGKISKVTLHFPPGVNALVDIRVLKGSSPIVPREGAISIDAFTMPVDTDVEVRKGETVTVSIDNTDDTYAHTVSAVVQITPKEGGGS